MQLKLQVTSGNFLKQFYSKTGNLKANNIYMPHRHDSQPPYPSVVMHNFFKEKIPHQIWNCQEFFFYFFTTTVTVVYWFKSVNDKTDKCMFKLEG